MITPHLEQLIYEGRAAFRTWQIGGSGVGRIPVASNHYAVVLGFTYSPFVDEVVMGSITDYNTTTRVRILHQLKLYTKSKSHVWAFREWFTPFSEFDTGNTSVQIAPGAPFTQSCYCIFEETIRVNIRANIYGNAPENWVNVDFGILDDTTKELAGPMNYGTASNAGTQVMRGFQWGGPGIDSFIQPVGDEQPAPPVGINDANDQFVTKANAALNNPTLVAAANQNGMNYPIVNFQYVEIFEPLPDKMRGTLL